METNDTTRTEPSPADWVSGRMAALAPDPSQQPDMPAINVAWQRLRQRRMEHTQRQRARSFAAVGVVAASASVVAFPASRLIAERCVTACVSQVKRVSQYFQDGPAREPFLETTLESAKQTLEEHNALISVGPTLGSLAPEFARPDASGTPVGISGLRGNVVLLNFWATWCQPCLVETPWFQGFQRQYASQGFTVLGVSMDEDGWAPVRAFLADHHLSYPVVLGDEALMRTYGVRELPTTFLIDRDGRITWIRIGVDTEGDLRTESAHEIERLLAR